MRLRPGVTDLASIDYSQESDMLDYSEDIEKIYIEKIMPEKHALNYAYIREMNLLNNIKVILKTLRKLLK